MMIIRFFPLRILSEPSEIEFDKQWEMLYTTKTVCLSN